MKDSKRWKVGKMIIVVAAVVNAAAVLYGVAAGFWQFVTFCQEINM